MHGVTIYWTKAQYWAHNWLLIVAIIFFGLRVAIAKYFLKT